MISQSGNVNVATNNTSNVRDHALAPYWCSLSSPRSIFFLYYLAQELYVSANIVSDQGEMATKPHVVIIGGSYSGTGVAHALLKRLPTIKVSLINTSESFYFNVAAPRALARPSEVPLDKVLIPIASAFKQYSTSQFEFVHGTVTSVNDSRKTVTVGAGKHVTYDYLVIASGSTTPSTLAPQCTPTKATSTDDLAQRIKASQSAIAAAKTICIGGNGAVGVELAGEIAEAYTSKKVVLVSATPDPLPNLRAAAGAAATSQLTKLGVEIVKNRKVDSAEFDSSAGQWTVKLNDGDSLTFDLYISAVGVLPNSSFLSHHLVTDEGWVIVNENLAAIGARHVYALGDITSNKTWTALSIEGQVKTVVANLVADINGGGVKQPYKKGTRPLIITPIGKKGGTGQMWFFVPWSFMVGFIKSKDYFVPKASTFISAK